MSGKAEKSEVRTGAKVKILHEQISNFRISFLPLLFSTSIQLQESINIDERRLWIGNLDSRITE